MPLKGSGDSKRRTTGRRKVALACDSCREKKTRCDGRKPICGPCMGRSYRVDQCIYNSDNARSASRDEYYRALHERIRELEDACLGAGIPVSSSPNSQLQREPPTDATGQNTLPAEGAAMLPPPAAPYPSVGTLEQNTPTSFATRAAPLRHHAPPGPRSQTDNNSQLRSTTEENTDTYASPLFDDGTGQITGMGQITAPAAESRGQPARFQFYGSSSTAALMRFAWQSMPSRPVDGPPADPAYRALQDTSTDYRFDDFALPPRGMADHLVSCFFNKLYIIYPFFHRPAFEAAYRNLWRGEEEEKIPLTELPIGLGSSADSGPRSIVFHSALNMIFALGCQFADIPPEEVELVANSFFLRGKRFIGLDFLDINTLGVIQTLLITALFLQSSPYPSRCWQSVGVACRVALGLGLHESDFPISATSLESEMLLRTWNGCVIMDVTLSMVYGRPSMTTHLAPFPPYSDSGPSRQGQDEEPSMMTFYDEAIKLYAILDRILSDVYDVWPGRSRREQSQQQPRAKCLAGLDTVLELERQLTLFEANLPQFLRWTIPHQFTLNQDGDGVGQEALARQRNVLHVRYVHLHLLLYRPIFTQLYRETVRKREAAGGAPGPAGQDNFNSVFTVASQSTLYSSMASNCVTACVMAAIDLTHLVHETYQTSTADAWWYDGYYVSTAAVVFLISFSAPSMLDATTLESARQGWREATSVLESLATFRQSARNTLQFLQAAYRHTVRSGRMPVRGSPYHQQQQQSLQTPLFNWEDYAANLGQGLDDLGFLTRLDLPEILLC
ncbi:transcription factor domain-containing protein [Aspergillus stella-maris]|uniref:transcription factor domain-containing protein n=1 Tax=Aspergillus stella-maris TaxID=1810926 RepID=UPI003CCDC7FB